MNRTPEQYIELAATMLDKLDPRWFLKVDPKRLDMQNSKNCIGGQIGVPFLDLMNEFWSLTNSTPFDDHAPVNCNMLNDCTCVFANQRYIPYWTALINKRKDDHE